MEVVDRGRERQNLREVGRVELGETYRRIGQEVVVEAYLSQVVGHCVVVESQEGNLEEGEGQVEGQGVGLYVTLYFSSGFRLHPIGSRLAFPGIAAPQRYSFAPGLWGAGASVPLKREVGGENHQSRHLRRFGA